MSSPLKLIVSADSNRGGRRYMEDITEVSTEGDGDAIFLAVFDGHGGPQAARFARRCLWPSIRAQPGLWGAADPVGVCHAIRDGFLACQRAMGEELVNWPRTPQGHPSTAGTTACCCLIRGGDELYVAHVGDSRAVIAQRHPRGGGTPADGPPPLQCTPSIHWPPLPHCDPFIQRAPLLPCAPFIQRTPLRTWAPLL
ncbi:protein phosphatase 1D-like [Petromyzon marinus]|uniref:protein phosphatase 1D-like n=1 Tax=Petromyzon marinus TaxID=7757 RepID=UPI003F7122FA